MAYSAAAEPAAVVFSGRFSKKPTFAFVQIRVFCPMLQVSVLKENPELVLAGLAKKHYKTAEADVAAILSLDQRRKELQTAHDSSQAEANELARQIGALMKSGDKAGAETLKARTAELKQHTKAAADELAQVEDALQTTLYKIPNLPHSSVPEGRAAADNEVVREGGTKPALPADALPHWELIKKYDIIDFELGNKITGAGFPVYKRQGARLQRALINFFLDQARDAGYDEVQPPILVNEASGYGTGQLPDKEGQMYHDKQDNLYLIPTSEVPITNLYRDEIISADQLPIRNTGYTPCFRREAGSWGADVRGLNRLHQFDKVEIVQITQPENSYAALDGMVAHIEGLLQKLELPYRILRLCGGDMGFTSALTFDLEVWSAAQGRWLEVSSASNFETYQANRLKLRYRNEAGKTQLLHTLNGSALALPRIVAALLENNQTPDGIRLPEVLHAYCGFEKIG
jgi:seryl-tRNA synthetase